MEIKYEAVFGDQELLSEAGIFTGLDVVTRNVDTDLYSYCRREDLTYNYLIKNPVVAMRRIIRTPTWTVADQKAGKLTEVGCVVMVSPNCTATVTAVDNIQKVVSVQCEDQALDILAIHEMLPIESPEEKAARLRAEWCRECTSKFYPRGRYGFPEMIHDALLSGDLPVPVKGE